MVIAVLRISERKVSGDRPKTPPIVPSMRGALENGPFRILLPAWLCDAFSTAIAQCLPPFFVEVVVAPAYQTMENNGRDCHPSSPGYDGGKWVGLAGVSDDPSYSYLCGTTMVTGCGCLLAMSCAILVLPIWKLIVGKVGTVQTWLLWSLTMAGTTGLFVFVGQGQIELFFVVAGMNGAPLGAKFLADAILSDIIDYDEFLTGTRSEATYFMFKSFLPKIVQIPASAVPVALLGYFGYLRPVGTRHQLQPASCVTYIKAMIFISFLISLVAYVLKRRYPLSSEERVNQISVSVKQHQEGEFAPDPISGMLYKPASAETEEEEQVFWLLDHFSPDRLEETFDGIHEDDTASEALHQGIETLSSVTCRQLIGCIIFFIVAVTGVVCTVPWLWNKELQVIPTLLVVCVGVSLATVGFSYMRRSAVVKLSALAEEGEEDVIYYARNLLAHHAEIKELSGKGENENGAISSDEEKEALE